MSNDYKKVISSKTTEAKKIMTNDQVKKCNVVIHTAAAAAGTEAFIPLPGVDAIPITATQITMIISLGKIFDQTINKSAATAVLGATASTFVGRSLVKLIPVAGWTASAAVAAGVTEAIGWTVAVDFANQASRSEKIEDSVATDSAGDSMNEEAPDDESISNEFSKMFEEDDE